ncbi:MAG: hypothetical protein WB607_29270, partial [Candidatus Acidiferrum sp.]
MRKLGRRIKQNLGARKLPKITKSSRLYRVLGLVLLFAAALSVAATSTTELIPADSQRYLADIKT